MAQPKEQSSVGMQHSEITNLPLRHDTKRNVSIKKSLALTTVALLFAGIPGDGVNARNNSVTLAFAAQELKNPSCELPEPTTAKGYQDMFLNYHTKAWSSGDGEPSIPLPQGTRLPDGTVPLADQPLSLWLKSDSWQGELNADGSIPGVIPSKTPDGSVQLLPPMIHNAGLLQYGGCLMPLTGPSDKYGPTNWITPLDHQGYYWLKSGVIRDNKLDIFLQKNSTLTNEEVGTDIAVIDPKDNFKLVEIKKTPEKYHINNGVTSWGAAVINDGDYTYIYGTDTIHAGTPKESWAKEVKLVRVKNGEGEENDITNPAAWEYLSGENWSSNPEAATPIIDASVGISADFDIHEINNQFVIATKNTDFMGQDIIFLTAPSPIGPWKKVTYKIDVPNPNLELGGTGLAYGTKNTRLTYSGDLHQMENGEWIVSWDINATPENVADMTEHGNLYGSHFAPVDMKKILKGNQ